MDNGEAMTEEHQSLKKDNNDALKKNKIVKIHKRIPSEIIPKLGLKFDLEDAAYAFL